MVSRTVPGQPCPVSAARSAVSSQPCPVSCARSAVPGQPCPVSGARSVMCIARLPVLPHPAVVDPLVDGDDLLLDLWRHLDDAAGTAQHLDVGVDVSEVGGHGQSQSVLQLTRMEVLQQTVRPPLSDLSTWTVGFYLFQYRAIFQVVLLNFYSFFFMILHFFKQISNLLVIS